MKVLVGSKNPVKIEATKEAFSKYFDNVEVSSFEMESKVSHTPMKDKVMKGARNRALALKEINKEKGLNADFLIGMEGGVTELHSQWFLCNSIFIINREGESTSGTFPLFQLPDYIVDEVRKGVELGDLMDQLKGEANVKKKGGATGFFTQNKINRKEFYVIGLISTLVPFINEELFKK